MNNWLKQYYGVSGLSNNAFMDYILFYFLLLFQISMNVTLELATVHITAIIQLEASTAHADLATS